MGRVPPELNLWKDEFTRIVPQPRPEMVLQVGHADRVTSLVCSADQRIAFSGSMDSTVRAWSLVDGSLLHVWTGQTVGTTALGLSRNDRWLVVGGGRGTIQAADLRDFSLVAPSRPPHTKRVDLIAMLPDGDHVISVDRDGTAALADLRFSPLQPKKWPGQDLPCLDISCGGEPENGTVAALFGDGTIRIFDAKGTGGVLVTPQRGRPTTLAVSSDGRTLAMGFNSGQIVLRDVNRG